VKLDLWKRNINYVYEDFSMFDRSNAAFDDEELTKLQLVQPRLSVGNAKRNPKPTSKICKETMQLV